jgi:hypothetical protein
MSTSVSTRSPGSLNPTRQQLDELDALLQRMLDLPVNQLDDSGESNEGASAPPPVQTAPPRTPAPRPPEPRPMAAPPVSYMVVETASPRLLPAASGFEPSPAGLSMRLLPVTPEEDSSVEEEPAPAPGPTVVPEQTPVADPPSAEGGGWVPLRSTWQPSAQTWQPLAESWQQANAAVPAPAAMPIPIVRPPVDPAPPREVVLPAATPTPVPVEFVIRRTAPAAAPPVPASPTPAEPRLTLSAEDASVPSLLLPLVWFNQGFDAFLSPLGAPGRWLSGRRGRQALGVVGLLCLAAAVAIAVSAGMGWTW